MKRCVHCLRQRFHKLWCPKRNEEKGQDYAAGVFDRWAGRKPNQGGSLAYRYGYGLWRPRHQ